MALDITFQTTFSDGTTPPPPPSADADNLAYFFPDRADRDYLAEIDAAFATPNAAAQGENTWDGDDHSGFAVQTVASADALITTIAALGPNDQVVIELDWDGESSTGTRAFTGLNSTTLTANGAVDWGYDRPASSIVLRPATGRSPILTGTFGGDTAFVFFGVSKLEVDGVTFGSAIRFDRNATRPALPMIALKNVTMQNASEAGCDFNLARKVYIRDFTAAGGNQFVFNGAAQYWDEWGVTVYDHLDNDIHAIRGYDSAIANNWDCYFRIGGVVCWDYRHIVSGGLHPDFLQFTKAGSTEQHRSINGYSAFVMSSANTGPNGYHAQNTFGDDTPAAGTKWRWLKAQELSVMGAFAAMTGPDFSGDSDWRAKNILVCRSPELSTTNSNDTVQRMNPYQPVSDAGAAFTVARCVYSEQASFTAQSGTSTIDDDVRAGNTDMTFFGATGAQPLFPHLTGWRQRNGRLGYDYVDTPAELTDATDRAEAFAALRAAYETSGGWARFRSGAGCADPNDWPTDFAAYTALVATDQTPDLVRPARQTITPTGSGFTITIDTPPASDQPITGYKYSTDGGATWSGLQGSAFSITGLSGATQYDLSIRAVSSVGDGDVHVWQATTA